MARSSYVYFIWDHFVDEIVGVFTVKHEMFSAYESIVAKPTVWRGQVKMYRLADGLMPTSESMFTHPVEIVAR